MIPKIEGVGSEIVRVGCPYHGIHNGDSIHLTAGGTKSFPNSTRHPVWGRTLVSRSPYIQPTTVSAADALDDAADGREWRDYSLLSGTHSWIGGVTLGNGFKPGSWVYYDPNGTPWLIHARAYPIGTAGQIKITVTLSGMVGVPQIDWLPSSDIVILDTVVSRQSPPSIYAEDPVMIDRADYDYLAQPNESGNLAFLNLYLTSVTNEILTHRTVLRYLTRHKGFKLATLTLDSTYLLTISGTGDLTQGSLGAGIGAALTPDKNYTDLHTSSYVNNDTSSDNGPVYWSGYVEDFIGYGTYDERVVISEHNTNEIYTVMARVFVGNSESEISLRTSSTYDLSSDRSGYAEAREALHQGIMLWVIDSVSGTYSKVVRSTYTSTLQCGAATYVHGYSLNVTTTASLVETGSGIIPSKMIAWENEVATTTETGSKIDRITLVHGNILYARHWSITLPSTYSLYGTYGHTETTTIANWYHPVYLNADTLNDVTYQPILGEFTEIRASGPYIGPYGACYV